MFTGLKIQDDLSGSFLSDIIPDTHELVKFKQFLDWDEINRIYRGSFPKAKNKHRPGTSSKTTDLSVGLTLLKQIYDWTDRELIRAVHENMAVMTFCSVTPLDIKKCRAAGKEGVIDHTTLVYIRKRLGKKGLAKIERAFFRQIKEKGLIKGRRMIADTTSLEKKILYPTEVGLLKRVIEHAEMIVQGVVKKGKLVKSAVIKAANKLVKVYYSAGKRTTELLHQISRKMAQLARETIAKADQAVLRAMGLSAIILVRIHEKVKDVGEKILDQIERKLAGQAVADKIVSYYEPHVRALPKGKVHKPCEFGTKATLVMSENGYVTDYDLKTGNPNEKAMLPALVERHAKEFGEEFQEGTMDAEFADAEQTLKLEKKHGIILAIPDKKSRGPGRGLDPGRQLIYKKRSAIEAKISEGKRVHGMGKSDYEGFEGDWICLTLSVFALNAKKIMRSIGPDPVMSG